MTAPTDKISPAFAESFRDPDGSIVVTGDDFLFRNLTPSGIKRLESIESLKSPSTYQAAGRWVASERVPGEGTRLRHPRVFFPSYPHEWSPTMLHRGASLTLEITMSLLAEGWELKDGTPANILFEGPHALFVDYLSPTQRENGQMGWRAYGQFSRTFLIPLALQKILQIPTCGLFLSHRDGLPPEMALPMVHGLRKFQPDLWNLITLPAWLARRKGAAAGFPWKRTDSEEFAREVTGRILRGLDRRLRRILPSPALPSQWSGYQDACTSYSAGALAAKSAFIQDCLNQVRPHKVLDLGCNTGVHSKMAARCGARVVAMDSDQVCIDRLFREAEGKTLDILPLLVDLGRPSPALGWDYQEEISLLDRLDGRFDMTFALALVHHLLVRERVPLEKIAAFLARTTRQHLILEWIPPADPQFRRLSGTNQELYEGLTIEQVLFSFAPFFRVCRSENLDGSLRSLHLLERHTLR